MNPFDRRPHERGIGREVLAEFLGTFVLIVFGVGVVAQTVLSKGSAGTPLSINIAWGLAVTMGCYVSAGVTGAHLNPAVTLALAVHRRFPWNKVVPYIAGADCRRVRRVGGGLRHLSRGADRVRRRHPPGHRPLRHRRHLGDLPAAVPQHVSRRLHRSGRRHRAARRRHLRHHRRAQLAAARRSDAGRRRPARAS